MPTNPQSDLRAVFTVTIETRKGGDYYFDHDDLVRNVTPWIEGALEDRDDIRDVTVAEAEPADRAAIYREVADRLAADAEQGDKEGFTRIYRRSAAKQVREWADEAQQPEAQLCGAWGGCTLPRGHNMGQADVPSNHRPPRAEPTADPSWPRRAWDLGLLHKGGDPHHCPACLKQPEPPANFVCPGDNTEVLANPQPSKEA